MAYVAMTAEEEADNLRETVVMLNDASERRDDWKGKNWSHDDAVWLRRMVRAHRGLDGKIQAKDRERLAKFIERIGIMADGTVADFYAGDIAAMSFWRLRGNSQQSRLRVPCRTCDRWYVSKTNRETDFCSRACAGSAAHAAKRKREHDRKIKKARAAIGNYPGRPARFAEMDWKQFVSKAEQLSKKFLTVAVRNGELLPPRLKVSQNATLK
jgi:hypothetical protein